MGYNQAMRNSLEKKTKAEQAAEQLEAAIINCTLKPGTVMTETEISEFLDIGRTPVREALMRLANNNMVRLSRAGVVIPELNPITMLKLLEPRALIEKLSIEKAVERLNDYDVEQIEHVIQDLQSLDDSDRAGFMEQLSRIHDIIAESSKNEFIAASIKTTQGLSRRFWCYYATNQDQQFCTKLYIRKLKALAQKDQSGALAASAELLTYLQAFTKAQLDLFQA